MSKFEQNEAGYRESLKAQGLSPQKVTAMMRQLQAGKEERVADYEGFLQAMQREESTPELNAETEPKPTQVEVTVSDEEYSELLEIRLAAKHGFDEGTVTLEEYNQARTAVRRARKIRRTEGAVVANYKQQSAPQRQAMTRKSQAA